MVGALEMAFEHAGVEADVAGAEGEGADEIAEPDRGRARTEDEQAAGLGGAGGVAGEAAVGAEAGVAGGAGGHELGRIADDEIVAALAAGLPEGGDGVLADVADAGVEAVVARDLGGDVEGDGALVDGEHVGGAAAGGREREGADEGVGVEHAATARELLDPGPQGALVEVKARLLAELGGHLEAQAPLAKA